MSKPEKLRDLRTAPNLVVPKPARRPLQAVRVSAPPRLPPASVNRSLRLSRLLDSLPMRALRRFMIRIVSNIVEIAVYVAIATGIGLSTAWYMVDYGSRLTVERDGPWQRWTIAGAPGADPYTKAHFARAGWLPVSTVVAHYHIASKDSSGEALYTDCDYQVSGPAPLGHRWTLAAFDMQGRGVPSGAGQTMISSSTALPGPEATISIRLSQATSPGNWLGLTGSSRMQLLLTQYGRSDKALKSATGVATSTSRRPLPEIVRTGCR
jgi:hypothetical protein